MSFSENLERLDTILRSLESEPLPLEEALSIFEEGVALVKESEALLRDAEQKVTVLAGEDGGWPDDEEDRGENEEEEGMPIYF